MLRCAPGTTAEWGCDHRVTTHNSLNDMCSVCRTTVLAKQGKLKIQQRPFYRPKCRRNPTYLEHLLLGRAALVPYLTYRCTENDPAVFGHYSTLTIVSTYHAKGCATSESIASWLADSIALGRILHTYLFKLCRRQRKSRCNVAASQSIYQNEPLSLLLFK